ncbi:hypothetical protein [Legionella cardiaca]|uniref:Uncharacterized protein n=1 Tax=Legionella cardiaca TaxID=1071983 RepID=A0ABY8ANL6_9GAMM|nr:hypothetical protein [Legionella cardiaca]WED42240.1 hypothetical protein PXX05_09900 [Legionella cardiaca]
MVKKLAGNLLEVFNAQWQDESSLQEFAHHRGKEENKDVLQRDIPRTSLVDFTGTFDDFSAVCLSESTFEQHYLQGNLDGGLAVDIYTNYVNKKVSALYEEAERFSKTSAPRTEKDIETQNFISSWFGQDNKEELRFAYRDDDGQLCSFGFIANKHYPDKWVLQISKNTTAPIANRTMNLFANDEFTSPETGTQVELLELPQQIKKALGSMKVFELVSTLIQEDGTVSFKKITELNQRIMNNANIDNRDFKKAQLHDYIQFIRTRCLSNTVLESYINELETQSNVDIDFFKKGDFEQTLQEMYNRIDISLSKIANKELAATLELNNKLTFFAIRLKLLASSVASEPINLALNEQSEKLLAQRESLTTTPETVKNRKFSEWVQEALNQSYQKQIAARLEEHKKALEHLNANKPLPPPEFSQSFLQRHYPSLLVEVFSLLVIISLFFVPAGPIVLVVAAIAGVIGIAASAKVGYDEKQFLASQQKFFSASNKYKKELGEAEEKNERQTKKFSLEFTELTSKIMEHVLKEEVDDLPEEFNNVTHTINGLESLAPELSEAEKSINNLSGIASVSLSGNREKSLEQGSTSLGANLS